MAIAVEVGDQQLETARRIGRLLRVVDGVVSDAAADADRRVHLGLDLLERMPIGERAARHEAEQQRQKDRQKQPIAQRQAGAPNKINSVQCNTTLRAWRRQRLQRNSGILAARDGCRPAQ